MDYSSDGGVFFFKSAFGHGAEDSFVKQGLVVAMMCGALASISGAADIDPRLLPPSRANAPVSLIPYPQQVDWTGSWVVLNGAPKILPDHAVDGDDAGLARVRGEIASIPAPEQGVLRVLYGAVDGAPPDQREAYALTIAADEITLKAPTTAGLFYAVQTLRQMIDGARAPTCHVVDWPAFPIRGFMQDVGRNFQTLDLLRRQIDLAARYKLNVFHWHLTDNPGFRIESKAFPALNQAENYRPSRDPGKFYTYDEMRALQAYAAERQMEIIPEIDVPGHSAYFQIALGYDMQSPEGLETLQIIFREFLSEFQSRYVHVGGDEVKITNTELLPSIFRILREHHREAIMWHPGGALEEGAITHLWMASTDWEKFGPVAGHKVIDSRAYYFNTTDALQGMARWFFSQPASVPEATPDRLGAIACAWPDVNIDDENMGVRIMPIVSGLITFAERTWRGAREDRHDLGALLPAQGTWEYAAYRLFERDLLQQKERLSPEWFFPYVRHTDMAWEIRGPLKTNDALLARIEADPYAVEGWEGPLQGGTVHLHFWRGYTGPLQDRLDGHVVYARARWTSDRAREVGLWAQLHGTPFASGRGANPPEGKWVRESQGEGNIWINGVPVPAPHWIHPGLMPEPGEIFPLYLRSRRGNETPFTNEGYWYRDPSTARLKQGVNTILLRVPARSFTLVPVESDARGVVHRAEGVQILEQQNVVSE